MGVAASVADGEKTTNVVHLRGVGVADALGGDNYYLSNTAEDGGSSWGAKDRSNAWALEWDGDVRPGMTVHLRGLGCPEDDTYYYSNHGEGVGASWGAKDADNAWTLEWDGELTPGSVVHLKGIACEEDGKYYWSNTHEDAPHESDMASWGAKDDGNAWIVEWADEPAPPQAEAEAAEAEAAEAKAAEAKPAKPVMRVTWAMCKKMLGKVDFLDQLLEFNTEFAQGGDDMNIPDEVWKQVEEFCADKMCTPEIAGRTSDVAADMCSWIHGVYKIHTLLPKVAEFKALKASGEEVKAEAIMAEVQPALHKAMDEVSKLNGLDKACITEVKAYDKPPQAVMAVMYHVGLLMLNSNQAAALQ